MAKCDFMPEKKDKASSLARKQQNKRSLVPCKIKLPDEIIRMILQAQLSEQFHAVCFQSTPTLIWLSSVLLQRGDPATMCLTVSTSFEKPRV